jgi:hypothetical protein
VHTHDGKLLMDEVAEAGFPVFSCHVEPPAAAPGACKSGRLSKNRNSSRGKFIQITPHMKYTG